MAKREGGGSMNDLQVFNSPEFGDIRAVEVDGEPWFVGKDMAEALGYSNSRDALAKHVDDEDKAAVAIRDGSQNRDMTIINESGVYSLIFSSRLESAKKFKHWVTSEVLPTIRKHGAYIAPSAQPEGVEAAALQAVVQPITAALEALTGMVQAMSQRLDGLEQSRNEMKSLPPPPERNPFDDDNPFAGPPKPSSIPARKLWMRLVNEKLDLLSQRFGKSHSAILHKIYQDMEESFQTVLDEERCRVMEEQGLEKCSVLLAIFFDPELRDYFQRYVDINLAPENRGW